jgi:hypothetical protein
MYNSQIFSIDPKTLSEGVHKLSINATFTSGTGSLAEMLGLEKYNGEIMWIIKVVHNIEEYFKPQYRKNEDGFLEVMWNNTFPESQIEKYTVKSGLTQADVVTINNASQKYFVDYGYVCGYAHYEIQIFMKDGYRITHWLSIDKPTPKIYFENIDLNNLRVYWDKPFANGRFLLNVDNQNLATDIDDTTFIVSQLFGKNRQFSVEIRPQKTGFDNIHNKFNAWGWFNLGNSLGLPNWELFAYNLKDNILYTRKYNSLVAIDGSSMQEINSVSIMGNPWGFAYGGKIATAPHNSTIAAMTGEETWIFTDSRFTNPIRISPLSGSVNTRLAALTSDDRFFVVQGGSNICKVFNSLTGEKQTEFSFTYKTIYDIPDHVSVSADGQYFCAASDDGIEIFEIKANTANKLYTDTRQYRGAMFLASQSDKLLLRVDSKIEIRKIPGFELKQTLDVSSKGAVLCNIDPASMNLLYHQDDSLRVCNIDNLNKTIFQIRSDEKTCKIFNNKLLTFGKGGIYLDISPHINN